MCHRLSLAALGFIVHNQKHCATYLWKRSKAPCAPNLESSGIGPSEEVRRQMSLDPRLLGTFRSRIANPLYWRRAHQCLRCYSREALATPDGCAALVDHMSTVLNVPLSPAQRAGATNWLYAQRIDPRHPWHQARMWSVVNGA